MSVLTQSLLTLVSSHLVSLVLLSVWHNFSFFMVNNLQRINSVLNGVYTFGMQNYNYFLRRKSYDGLFFKK